jgi:hypothetical protein
MYSVVLMMAMTSGVDVPVDGLLHKGSCSGSSCYGGYSGTCYGGCYGSTYGSCYGSCYGSSACSGSSCHGGHKMFGGMFGGHHHSSSCCGGAAYAPACCGGAYYGAPCSGGCSGMPVAPPVKMPGEKKPEEKKPEEVKPPKVGDLNVPAPATLIVSLPADAKLLVDNTVTTSTSAERVFVSPTLVAGQVYSYTLKAEFV